jgi:hypothetical protein
LASLLALAAFSGGLVSGAVWHGREAHAQERPVTTTINVGPQGLVFRGPEGKAIARLSADPVQGGVFELFNAQELPGARMRAAVFTGTVDVLPSAAPAGGGTPAIARDLGF